MSKVYAIALALVILAVPAMAQSEFPPQDLDVNMTVGAMAGLWHAGNIGAIDLAATSAAPYYGITIPMSTNGNTDFTVSLEVSPQDMPDDVQLLVVTNANKDLWEQESRAVDGAPAVTGSGSVYRIWNPLWPEATIADWIANFGLNDATTSQTFQISQGLYPYTTVTTGAEDIYSYDYSTAGGSITSIQNLFAMYTGRAVPALNEAGGTAKAIFTITPTP